MTRSSRLLVQGTTCAAGFSLNSDHFPLGIIAAPPGARFHTQRLLIQAYRGFSDAIYQNSMYPSPSDEWVWSHTHRMRTLHVEQGFLYRVRRLCQDGHGRNPRVMNAEATLPWRAGGRGSLIT